MNDTARAELVSALQALAIRADKYPDVALICEVAVRVCRLPSYGSRLALLHASVLLLEVLEAK
jgi:hypothetical protein